MPIFGESIEQQELLLSIGRNKKMLQPLKKRVLQFLKNLNIPLPCDPAIMLLDILTKELNTYVHKKSCTQMFIAASFITVKVEETKISFSR